MLPKDVVIINSPICSNPQLLKSERLQFPRGKFSRSENPMGVWLLHLDSNLMRVSGEYNPGSDYVMHDVVFKRRVLSERHWLKNGAPLDVRCSSLANIFRNEVCDWNANAILGAEQVELLDINLYPSSLIHAEIIGSPLCLLGSDSSCIRRCDLGVSLSLHLPERLFERFIAGLKRLNSRVSSLDGYSRTLLGNCELPSCFHPTPSRVDGHHVRLINHLAPLSESNTGVIDGGCDPSDFKGTKNLVPSALALMGFCLYGYCYWCAKGGDNRSWLPLGFIVGLCLFAYGVNLVLQPEQRRKPLVDCPQFRSDVIRKSDKLLSKVIHT